MNDSRFWFLIRRLVLMIGGEAVQSGFHFALNISMLHLLSAHDYGIFALSMVMGGVGLAYTRSLSAIPASVWIGRARSQASASAYDVTFGSVALLFSMVMAAIVALLSVAWGSDGAIAGGLFVGLWSLRSYLRTSFFARHRQWIVSCSDLCFTLVGLAAAAFAIWRGQNVLGDVFKALALANGTGIAVLLVLARAPVRISFRARVRRRYAGLWPQLRWSAFSVTTSLVQGQCIALMVTATAGPTAFAPIAAVLTLFAPLRIIATAFDNMMQPELSASLARGERRKVWTQVKIWTVVMALGALAYGGAVFAIAPFIKSEVLEGARMHSIGVLAWAAVALSMLYVMPRLVLESLNDFWTLAKINTVAALAGLTSIALLLAIASPSWSLAGAAFSEAIVVVSCWAIVHRKIGNVEQTAAIKAHG